MEWTIEVNHEKGIIIIREGGRVIAWAHTVGDTLIGRQLVLAFNDLVKEHNKRWEN